MYYLLIRIIPTPIVEIIIIYLQDGRKICYVGIGVIRRRKECRAYTVHGRAL